MTDTDAMEIDRPNSDFPQSIQPPCLRSSTSTSSDVATEPDIISELSEPPSDLEDDVFMDVVPNRSRKRRAPSTTPHTTELLHDVQTGELEIVAELSPRRHKRLRPIEQNNFTKLPKEILNNIATVLPNDSALYTMSLTCQTSSNALVPENAAHWRLNFLACYDYPFVYGPYEYCAAYRLRRFVLHTLGDRFENGNIAKAEVQLECIRDMVLEAYNVPGPAKTVSAISKNLALFASPDTAPWILSLLSTPFWIPPLAHHNTFKRHAARGGPPLKNKSALRRCGAPHALFDAIQVTLTYLLLSPLSALAHQVNTDRANYNIAEVYCWQRPLKVLFHKVTTTDDQKEFNECLTSPEEKSPHVNSYFPNLPRKSISSKLKPRFKYELDMHSILHIRNFWHRHLIDDANGFETSKYTTGTIVEDSYAVMANKLVKAAWLGAGRCPRKWESQLQECDAASAACPVTEGPQKWFGHYSCIHKWPKKREELDERQCCAADWTDCDPMMLEMVTTKHSSSGYWPGIFSSIPLLETGVPDPAWFGHHSSTSEQKGPYTYLRGLAGFPDLNHTTNIGEKSTRKSTSSTPATPSALGTTMYHPFLSLRLRGIVHPIPTSLPPTTEFTAYTQPECGGIPGWQRVIMVMYKPNTRYLVQVLERSMEEYGDPFTQMVPGLVGQIGAALGVQSGAADVDMGNVPNAAAAAASTTIGGDDDDDDATATIPQTWLQQPNTLNPEQLERALKQILEQKVEQVERRWEEQFYSSDSNLPSSQSPQIPSPFTHRESSNSPPSDNKYHIPYFWTSHRIAQLEDEHVLPGRLAWDDIEYAYAYEGVITPGGKVMMGRWWRCASPAGGGVGIGLEVGGEAEMDGSASVEGERERGPFCFWC